MFRFSPLCFFGALLLLQITLISHTSLAAQAPVPYSIEARPDWVENTVYDSKKELQIQQPSQYLLADRQINLVGGKHQFYRYVSRTLSTKGVGDISELHLEFNPAFQTLQLHSIKVIRDGKVRDVTNSSTLRLIEQEKGSGNKIYMGLKSLMVIIEDVRVNDIIDYSYSIKGQNPIFAEKKFGAISLDWQVLVDQLSIKVIYDNKSPVTFKAINTALKNSRIQHFDKNSVFRLVRKNIPAVLNEGSYPHEYSPFSWLEYSEYSNWKQVNQWAASLYELDQPPSEAIQAIIKQLKNNSSSKEDYILKALQFVQNDIRYLGLEFGQNSHLPHPADEVLEKRFGDCKDKSQLFSVLLRGNNITSYPALVSTSYRHGIKQGLPSAGAFNHVITMLEWGNQRYWLDGTRTYQAGTLETIGKIDYGFALVIGHKEKDLMAVKLPEIKPIRQIVEEDFWVEDFDKTVSYQIKTIYNSNAAEYQRYRFDNTPIKDIQRNYLDYLKRFYSDISVQNSLRFEDYPDKNQFIVTENYTINNYLERNNDIIKTNMFLHAFYEYLKKPEKGERQSPFYIGAPKTIKHTIRLHYPEMVDLSFPNEKNTVANNALQYHYRDSYNDKTYTVEAELEIIDNKIEAHNYKAYSEFYKKLLDYMEYSLRVKDPAYVEGYREVIALKSRLKELAQ